MKVTRASVEEYAKQQGYRPVQIDGIPEGFVWKMPDINIGGIDHIGKYKAFIPLKPWTHIDYAVYGSTTQEVLEAYNLIANGK